MDIAGCAKPLQRIKTVDEPALWVVDFDWHKGKPFEHNWLDYRTRKDRSLKTVSDFGYEKYQKRGSYTACVKVIDVFGADTSITVKVNNNHSGQLVRTARAKRIIQGVTWKQQ